MPRKPRLFVSGATYHVYCRVARGEFVFEDPIEAEAFIDTVREVRDRDGLSIFAWCLMTNHYHLVLKTASVPLWRSTARLQGKVARGHNRRHGFLGRLWQSRYKARIIDSNQYFRKVLAYVHLNPVAAGIVDDPARYPLSGHREAIGRVRPFLLDLGGLLAAFHSTDRQQARDAYIEWVRIVAEERWFEDGIEKLPWWREAGHADEIVDAGGHHDVQTFDGQNLDDRPELGLAELADRFERASGFFLSDLASRKRDPSLKEGRIAMTVLASGRYGLRVCDVAKLLEKNPGTVSRWLAEADRRSSIDPSYRRHLDNLDRTITAEGPRKVIK